RMSQWGLTAEDQATATADAIHMATHQLGGLLRRTATELGHLSTIYQFAYAEADTALHARDRFARQHGGAERLGQHRHAIEHRRIACSQVYRQYRHFVAQGKASES